MPLCSCSRILLQGCCEKFRSFQQFFNNIGGKPAFQKADFSASFFANVQGSRLRTVVKKYFFQKDDFRSPFHLLYPRILLQGRREKVILSHSSRTLVKSRLFRKPTFGHLFAYVQESCLRTVVKKCLFQERRLSVTFSPMCEDPASGLVTFQPFFKNDGEVLAIGKPTFRSPLSPLFKDPHSGLR